MTGEKTLDAQLTDSTARVEGEVEVLKQHLPNAKRNAR